MTQIEMSEPFDSARLPNGSKAEGLVAGNNFFGH